MCGSRGGRDRGSGPHMKNHKNIGFSSNTDPDPLKNHKATKVSEGAKIRNRYNQVPHLTQDTNGKVTNSQLDTTNQSQEGSPFPAGDHKAHINRRPQRHSKHITEQNTQSIHKRSTALERSVKKLLEGLNGSHGANHTLNLNVDQDT